MANLKKYDLSAKQVGETKVEDSILSKSVNKQMIKDYLVAIRNNARQWSANTKGRKEVKCSNIKPHKQKGTGRARQGSLAAPHYRGGGIVFGPKPKFDQHAYVNKKEKRAAISQLISAKIKDGKVNVLQPKALKKPQTKQVAEFIKKMNMQGKRILFLLDNESANENFIKSLRNIPKVEYTHVSKVNGYNLSLCDELVLMEPVADQLSSILGKVK